MAQRGMPPRKRSPYLGWVAAGLVLLITFAAAAAVWFIYHP